MPAIECAYCGLPCPGTDRATLTADTEPQYCCYGCRLASRITGGADREPGALMLQRTLLGVAIFLSMNVMVVGWVTYGQEAYGAEDAAKVGGLSAATISMFRYLAMLFTAPVLVILGWPIAEMGWRNLRRGIISTELLIALGSAAAFVFSYIAVMRGHGAPYFDTVCMILVLVTLGKYLEASARIRTTSALHELEALLPEQVTVVRGSEHLETARAEVRAGNAVLVRPGSRVPVDGVIDRGSSTIDEQIITGESQPRAAAEGDTVYAGSLNGDGVLVVRATAVGAGTVLHEVIDLLTAARRSKGRYERLADRVTAWFVPLVLTIAAGAAIHALRTEGIEAGIMRFLAVLLISCPCALGLATPMAIWVALGHAARRGILFRTADALEILARVRCVCFDKTGTLTTGEAAVADLAVAESDDAARVLAVAHGLARDATHHLSTGIVTHARNVHARVEAVVDVTNHPGRGIGGYLGETRAPVALGSPAFMTEQNMILPPTMAEALAEYTERGRSVALVGIDDAVRGVFAFAEDLREGAGATIAQLHERGAAVRVLTGDHAARGQRLAEALGVEVETELLPADKLARLNAIPNRLRPVAMVGDGINDAPALAAADVGVALGCGADVTRETADVTLASDDPRDLLVAMDLSARTIRVIRQNLFWAFGYNVVGIYFAATGRLSPIFAALAMVLSSLLVVSNSLRLRGDGDREKRHEVVESRKDRSPLRPASTG
jgi:heavy metal translocating P-type ATPase